MNKDNAISRSEQLSKSDNVTSAKPPLGSWRSIDTNIGSLTFILSTLHSIVERGYTPHKAGQLTRINVSRSRIEEFFSYADTRPQRDASSSATQRDRLRCS